MSEVYLNGMLGEYIDDFIFPNPVYTDTTTSILPVTGQNDIKAYLDNTGNRLIIQSQDHVTNLLVYDLHGREMGNLSGFNISNIDVSSLPKGMYVILLETESKYIHSLKFE